MKYLKIYKAANQRHLYTYSACYSRHFGKKITIKKPPPNTRLTLYKICWFSLQCTYSFPESGSRKHFQGSGMRAIDSSQSLTPRIQKIMRFGTLFDKSKKISKRGFLALTKKINFSTLRIENFAKMTSPIDSPPKITYRYVQSSRFELFFHEQTWKNSRCTLFAYKITVSIVRFASISKSIFWWQNPFLTRFFFSI